MIVCFLLTLTVYLMTATQISVYIKCSNRNKCLPAAGFPWSNLIKMILEYNSNKYNSGMVVPLSGFKHCQYKNKVIMINAGSQWVKYGVMSLWIM